MIKIKKKNVNGTCKTSGTPLKDQTCILGIEKGEEVQATGLENIFDKLIAEKFTNVEKEMIIQVQEVFRTTNRPKNNLSEGYYSETLNMQKKEKVLKAAREK
jgi:hypothetical protein